jgi:hypothetical protein
MSRKIVEPADLFMQMRQGWRDLKATVYRGSLPPKLEKRFTEYVYKASTPEELNDYLATLKTSKRAATRTFFFHDSEAVIGAYFARPGLGRYYGRHIFEFRLGIVDVTTKDNKGKGYIALPPNV